MASLALNLAVGIVTNTLLGWLTPKEGPRIMDLSAPKSSYGQMIPKIIGNCLVGGNVIWAQPKREVKRKAGKGAGNKGATTYAYFGDFAVAICQGPIVGISRIWLNEKIVYDYTYDPTGIYPTQNNPPSNPANGSKYTVGTKPTGLWAGHEYEVAEWQSGRWYFYPAGSTSRAASDRFARYIRIYNGTASQQPDPLIQAKEGVDRTPAFRGLAYIVFEGLPLSDEPGSLFDFGGNFPRVKVEVVAKGSRHPIDGYFVREETELKEAVKILAMEGGLDANEIDSDALSGSLWGYAITSQKTVRDCIADLISLFHFDLFDGDKLIFLPPERITAVNIKRAELAAHEGNSDRPNDYTHTIVETVTLPYEVALVYFSRERDYQEEMVYGRRVTANIRNKNTTQMPVVLQKWQAQTAADIGVHLAWIRRHAYKFTLSAKYCRLQAGDRISVELDFGTEDLVISRLDLGANLLISIEAYRYTSLTNYGGYVAATEPIMPSPSTITDYGNTLFWLLDIPLIQDADTDYGIYVAMRGSLPKWRSGTLYYSSDGGANYTAAKRANTPTIMGTVSTALGGWSGSGIDTINTITLELEIGELAAPSGLFLLGDEILSANTVTLIGVRTYELSNLTRGLRGTDWAIYSHTNNERFYLLSTVQRITGTRADLSQSKLYKAISSGQALEDVTATSFTYTGKDLEPYPVASVGAYKIGSDIVIQWLRRDRHDADAPANVAPKLSEFDERYEIDIINAGNPVRTLASTSPKVTYSAADQIADFGGTQNQITCIIYQISEVVSRGYPKTFTSGILTTTPPIIPVIPLTPSSLASDSLQKSQNLADVPNKALARQNLEIPIWTDTSIKTGNYTAQAYDRIPCNTGSGSFTITLPGSGNLWVYDAIGNSTATGFGVNPLVLAAPVGSTIMGQPTLTVSVGGSGLILGKVGTDWRILNQYGSSAGSGFANPMTTLGDLIIGGSAGIATRFAPNNSGILKYLSQGLNQIPWTIADINTEVWFDGLDLADFVISSGFVETWLDKSGKNRHATQTDAALRPYYDATLKGVKNIQENRYLLSTLAGFIAGTGNSYQVYMVVTPSENKGSVSAESTSGIDFFSERNSLNIVFGATNNSGTDISTYYGISGDSVYGTETKSGIAPFYVSRSSSGGIGNKTLVSIKRDYSRQLSSSINFGTSVNAQIGTTDTIRWDSLYLPFNYGGGNSQFNGTIHAFVVVFGNLSNDDDQRVQGYLAHRWNMTASMANDHPYKFNPPTKPGTTIITEWKEVATITTIATQSANYTAHDKERIPCNTIGGSFTITLPSSGSVTIFDTVATNASNGFGANSLTITPGVGDTIMGNSSLVLSVGGTSIELEKIGSDWRIISKFTL